MASAIAYWFSGNLEKLGGKHDRPILDFCFSWPIGVAYCLWRFTISIFKPLPPTGSANCSCWPGEIEKALGIYVADIPVGVRNLCQW